jgi:hypothetical protein
MVHSTTGEPETTVSTVTVPVGVPAAAELTVAVKVGLLPYLATAEDRTRAVVVAAGVTVRGIDADVEVVKLASPL